MRSRAAIANHPLHPAAVAVPIGAFTVALVADLLTLGGGDPGWSTTARQAIAIGIVGALVAALLGFIDYFRVPMSAAGGRIAKIHMLLNLAAVALYAWSWWLRSAAGGGTPPLACGVAVVAFLLLGTSGWLGGNLVFKHKVGVVENEDPEATAIGQRERA
jgi:uncharacterized membrane protein